MTKFYNYINEMDEQKQKKIVSHLKKCKPFIADWKISGGELLYSGRKMMADYIVKPVRQNRQPLDTSYKIHDKMDDQFYKKFGIKARSNSIFCTSILYNAEKYGTPYYIFPIGNYEIIWSPWIFDLYSKVNFIDYLDIGNIVSQYKKGDLRGALRSGNEIMLHCKEYLAVKEDTILVYKMKQLIGEV